MWSAISSIGGALVGGIFGSNSAKQVNNAQISSNDKWNQVNADFANKQHDYQVAQNEKAWDYQMNRHKYNVEDLRAAGINPMLSNGASAPGQSMNSAAPGGSLSNSGVSGLQNPGQLISNSVTSGINSAIDAKRQQSQEALNQANVAQISENVLNLAASRNLTYASTIKIEQEVQNLWQQLKLTKEQQALVQQQTAKTRNEAFSIKLSNDQKQILTNFYKQYQSSLISKDLNLPTLIRTVMPGLEDTLRQLNWR